MSNLRLLNETTVTSGVSAFSVTDIFSADYDICLLYTSPRPRDRQK